MSENSTKGLFGLHGITGILILIVGLLVILALLTSLVITTQQESAIKPYDPTPIRNLHNLKKISTHNEDFAFIDAKNKDK